MRSVEELEERVMSASEPSVDAVDAVDTVETLEIDEERKEAKDEARSEVDMDDATPMSCLCAAQ